MGGARASQGFARGTPANIRRFGTSYASATVAQKRNRTMYGYTGSGMYTGQGAYRGRGAYNFGSLLKAASPYAKIAAEAGGRALLNSVPYGGAIRSGLNALGYKGMGAYTREGVSNDLVTGRGAAPTSSGVPQFQTLPGEDGSLMVSYREYIGDVFGNTTSEPFVVNSIPLNPGLETSFPWLSQIASNFKEYEWIQCVFDFRSMITDMTTQNGQLGQIIMTSEYNVDAQPYEDKNEMLTTVHAVSGKVIDDITHGVECDPRKLSGNPGKYIRTKPVLVGEDKKEYDLANFQYAVCDTPIALANLPLGQLYVSYTVKLRKARTFSARGNMISRWIACSPYTAAGVVPDKCSHLVGFSNTSVVTSGTLTAQQNNFPLSILSVGDGTLGTIGVLNEDTAIPATGYGTIGSLLKSAGTNLPFSDSANGLSVAQYNLLQGQSISNRLVFPASFSGVVRVLVLAEVAIEATAATTESYAISLPLLCGNITCVKDMYGGMFGTLSSEHAAPIGISRNVVAGRAAAFNTQLFLLLHLKVKPASNGVDNSLIWTNLYAATTADPSGDFGSNLKPTLMGTNMITGTGATANPSVDVNVRQASIDVQEYNSSFAQSNSIPVPLFVNRDGTVVTPA